MALNSHVKTQDLQALSVNVSDEGPLTCQTVENRSGDAMGFTRFCVGVPQRNRPIH